MTEIRQLQLEAVILEKIAAMIVSDVIKDHRVGRDIDITRVKLAKDSSLVKVYISSYKSRASVKLAAEGLNSAGGFIRVALGKTLKSRNTPKPIFFVDDSLREGFFLGERIKEVVAEITDDAAAEEPADE
ncbi:MAG: 30S ribosome-binding factor RbfA [Spirochaetaceae bacterium]|nr:30S ribosome-binding factor RbfA [Spirochaetaceae bacterium]